MGVQSPPAPSAAECEKSWQHSPQQEGEQFSRSGPAPGRLEVRRDGDEVACRGPHTTADPVCPAKLTTASSAVPTQRRLTTVCLAMFDRALRDLSLSCFTCLSTGWHITHTALRTDMRMLAEAFGALRTWLDADEALKAWQVTVQPELVIY